MRPADLSSDPATVRLDAGGKENEQKASSLAARMALQWKNGHPCSTEEILRDCPEIAADPQAAMRVLYEEICLRAEIGEAVTHEELVARFPHWQRDIGLLLECHELLKEPAEPQLFPAEGEDFYEFRILREIGRGVHGRVYLADQPHLAGRLVVLKLTPCSGREHLQLARLQHTNIVPLYSARDIPERNLRCLCMPFLGGASLAYLIEHFRNAHAELAGAGSEIVEELEKLDQPQDRHHDKSPGRRLLRRMTFDEACCWIGVCVADALHHAHEQGMVHFDLKPSNILIAADARPMLLDFHLARHPIAKGMSAEWIGGTPAYMSPEQYEAWRSIKNGGTVEAPVDSRSDIYSLGIVLCEALGFKPANTSEPQDPADALEALKRLPQGLRDILRRCLEVQAADRYPTAAAVADDLKRHLQHLPLRGVRNRSLTERLVKWRKRRPQALNFAILSVAFLLALATIGSSAVFRYWEAENLLEEGQDLLNLRRFARARDVLQAGYRKTLVWPVQTTLSAELSDELQRANAAVFVARMASLGERLRFAAAEETTSPSLAQELDRACQSIWKERFHLQQALQEPLLRERRASIRQDLFDFALLWIDLRRRLATNPVEAHAHAVEILQEIDDLVVLSDYLRNELRAHRAGKEEVGEKEIVERGDVAETAWQHFSTGRRALGDHEDQRAAAHFEQAIRLLPSDFWSWFYKGIASFRMGDSEAAVNAFTVAIALRPNAAECFFNRGLARSAVGDVDDAIADYTEALRISPDFGAAALNRGACYFDSARIAEAEQDFKLAASFEAHRPSAYLNWALVFESKGDYANAERLVDQVLEHNSQHRDALWLKSRLKGKQKSP